MVRALSLPATQANSERRRANIWIRPLAFSWLLNFFFLLISFFIFPNTGKYGPEIIPYLDTFYAVWGLIKPHMYPFSLRLFYLKDWVIVCEDQVFYEIHKYIVSILFFNFIKFIIFLYTFGVTSFAQYREYLICLDFI